MAKTDKAIITQSEAEAIIGNAHAHTMELIENLRQGLRLSDGDAIAKAKGAIVNSPSAIHDLFVLADKLETLAGQIKDAIGFATMNTLKDEDLLESGIDGIKVQRGATRYTYSGGSKAHFLDEVSRETGVIPEAILESCSFTLKGLADKVGLTQEAFLERFGGFEKSTNKPTIKRTW